MASKITRLSGFDPVAVNAMLGGLCATAERFVRAGTKAAMRREITGFMRYLGQGWEIPVPLPDRAFGPDDAAGCKRRSAPPTPGILARAIDGLEGLEIEIVTWSVRVEETLPAPARLGLVLDGPEVTAASVRAVFDPALGRPLPTAIVAREAMSAGQSLQGPAVIAERETSTVVTSCFQAVMQGDGSLLLLRKGADK